MVPSIPSNCGIGRDRKGHLVQTPTMEEYAGGPYGNQTHGLGVISTTLQPTELTELWDYNSHNPQWLNGVCFYPLFCMVFMACFMYSCCELLQYSSPYVIAVFKSLNSICALAMLVGMTGFVDPQFLEVTMLAIPDLLVLP